MAEDTKEHIEEMCEATYEEMSATVAKHIARCETMEERQAIAWTMLYVTFSTFAGCISQSGNTQKEDFRLALDILQGNIEKLEE